jgi:hypothetical protein
LTVYGVIHAAGVLAVRNSLVLDAHVARISHRCVCCFSLFDWFFCHAGSVLVQADTVMTLRQCQSNLSLAQFTGLMNSPLCWAYRTHMSTVFCAQAHRATNPVISCETCCWCCTDCWYSGTNLACAYAGVESGQAALSLSGRMQVRSKVRDRRDRASQKSTHL